MIAVCTAFAAWQRFSALDERSVACILFLGHVSLAYHLKDHLRPWYLYLITVTPLTLVGFKYGWYLFCYSLHDGSQQLGACHAAGGRTYYFRVVSPVFYYIYYHNYLLFFSGGGQGTRTLLYVDCLKLVVKTYSGHPSPVGVTLLLASSPSQVRMLRQIFLAQAFARCDDKVTR